MCKWFRRCILQEFNSDVIMQFEIFGLCKGATGCQDPDEAATVNYSVRKHPMKSLGLNVLVIAFEDERVNRKYSNHSVQPTAS